MQKHGKLYECAMGEKKQSGKSFQKGKRHELVSASKSNQIPKSRNKVSRTNSSE